MRRLSGSRFTRATFVALTVGALGAAETAAQPATSSDPVVIQLFSDVPRQPSEVFAAAAEPAFEVRTTNYDGTPNRIGPTIETIVTVPPNARVVIAGNAEGTAPFSIDNFLLFEVGNPAQRFLTGGAEPVTYLGTPVEQIGPSTFTPEALDITRYFVVGEPTSIRVFALDYGGVGYVGDVFLVIIPTVVNLTLEGLWETSWGLTNVIQTTTGYVGTYEDDNGRFYLRGGNGYLIGRWGEDAAAVECDSASPYLETSYFGILYTSQTSYNDGPFTISWSYCDVYPYTRDWYFYRRAVALEVAPTPSATVETLITMLEVERRRAEPAPAGETLFQFTDADASRLRDELMALGVAETDWPYLVETHFGQDADFDASRWDSFAEFAGRSHVSEAQRSTAAGFGEMLQSLWGVPSAAIEHLRGRFFHSESIRNAEVSGPYGDNFTGYVLQTIGNSDDPVLNGLLGESRQPLLDLLNPATPPIPPFIPAFALPPDNALPHDDLNDCRFNVVLARMRQADPAFSGKWDMHVNLSGLPHTLTNSSIHIKYTLFAGVREAMRRCEQKRPL